MWYIILITPIRFILTLFKACVAVLWCYIVMVVIVCGDFVLISILYIFVL